MTTARPRRASGLLRTSGRGMVVQDRRQRGDSVQCAARTRAPASAGRASLVLAVASLLAGSVQVQAPSCSTATSYMIYRISGGDDSVQTAIKASDFEYYGTQTVSCNLITICCGSYSVSLCGKLF